MLSLTGGLRSVALVAACTSALLAALPEGWHLAGSQPGEYECSIDPAESYNAQATTYLKSYPEIKTKGFGTLMRSFDATQYLGKRVRFSAFVKTEGVKSHGVAAWAGLWMRVDGKVMGANKTLAFDNMHDGGPDRSIKGTKEWKSYSVVLDVSEMATRISLGVTLAGSGAVWLSGVKIEPVGREVKVTRTALPLM